MAKTPNPRIGIDVTSALAQGGGIGRYTRELVDAVVQLGTEFNFTLFSARHPRELTTNRIFSLAKNVTFKEIPISEQWLYRIWYRLRLPISVQNFTGSMDLFHSPDFVLPPISKRVPTLLTVHDLSFVHFPEAYTESLVAYLNRVVPWSINRASHILADSFATQDDLINLWKVPQEKISVLYSGVGDHFKPVTSPKEIRRVRKKYKLGDGPYLISVGTVQPRKNYQMLIKAFREVAQNYKHNLIIVGGLGWMHEPILEEIHLQELEGRVRFLGFIDDRDLPALYSAATLFAFPSLYEGFGLPILEAMACGVPVIASNASCLPEVAGDAALLLPSNDVEAWTHSLLSLLDDMSSRMKMVGAGFLRARKFTWTQSARDLMEVYKNLLGIV